MKLSEVAGSDTPRPMKLSEVVPPEHHEAMGISTNNAFGAVGRGMESNALGAVEALRDVSPYLPAGPLRVVGELAQRINPEDLKQVGKDIEASGKNRSAASNAAQFVSEAATSPANLIPGGSLLRMALQGAGSAFLQPGDGGLQERGERAVAGGVLAPVMGKAVGAAVENLIGKPLQWVAEKTGLNEKAAALASRFGMNPKTSEAYKMAQEMGIPTKDRTPKQINDDIQNWFKSNTAQIGKNISTKHLEDINANVAISEHYDKAVKEADRLYTAARDAAKGLKQEVPDLIHHVNGLIGELSDSVDASERRALPALKRIQSRLLDEDAGPKVNSVDNYFRGYEKPRPPQYSVQNLLDLKTELNTHFNPKNLNARNSPLAVVHALTKDALQKSGQTSHAFGEALENAESHYINNVAPLKNGKVIGQFWKPEDYHAWQAVAAGKLKELPPEVAKRTETMLGKIKTVSDLDVLTKNMSREAGNVIKSAKAQQIIADAGLDAQKLSDPKTMAILSKALENHPDSQILLDTMRDTVEKLNERGIGNFTPQQMAEKEAGFNKTLKLLMSLVKQDALGVIKHAANEKFGEGAPANVAQGNLKAFSKAAVKGAPYVSVIPDTLGRAARSVPVQKASAIAVGQGIPKKVVHVQKPDMVPEIVVRQGE